MATKSFVPAVPPPKVDTYAFSVLKNASSPIFLRSACSVIAPRW